MLIAGNADSLYQRLMTAIRREDLRDDPALAQERRPRRADGEDRPGDRAMDFPLIHRNRC